MDYQTLLKVNEKLNAIDVKGKNYAPVSERVKGFRELCTNGRIETEIVDYSDGVITMKAFIYDEEGKLLATGYAQEKESSSYINRTSFVENCETSAIGRALGWCGIGVDGSIASADEMANAIMNQNDDKSTENTQKPAKGQKAQQRTAQKSDEQKDAELKAKATEDPDVLMVEQGGSAVDKKRARIKAELERTGVKPATVLGAYKVNSVDEMNDAQLVSAISRLKKSKDKS